MSIWIPPVIVTRDDPHTPEAIRIIRYRGDLNHHIWVADNNDLLSANFVYFNLYIAMNIQQVRI